MRLPETFFFDCPLKINCGNQALDHLPADLTARGAKAPLILANRERIGKRQLQTVIDAFKESGMTLGVYDRLAEVDEPGWLAVLAKIYRDYGCDCLIAVGNGSVVDLAKRLQMTISGHDHRAEEEMHTAAVSAAPQAPLWLVVTPGGDGYEATNYVNSQGHRGQPADMFPAAACIDPRMMKGSSNEALAEGALIGLAHAVEAFLDHTAGPMVRAFAHTAIGLIVAHLPLALRNQDRYRSMCAVVNGQLAAGCAFSSAPSGLCHALGAGLQAHCDLPFGHVLAVLLPHVIQQIGSEQPEIAEELLYPMVGEDIFAITAPDLKISRTKALFWDFFDAVGAELDRRIPASLIDGGWNDEQIKAVLSQAASGREADRAAAILHGATSTFFRS